MVDPGLSLVVNMFVFKGMFKVSQSISYYEKLIYAESIKSPYNIAQFIKFSLKKQNRKKILITHP